MHVLRVISAVVVFSFLGWFIGAVRAELHGEVGVYVHIESPRRRADLR